MFGDWGHGACRRIIPRPQDVSSRLMTILLARLGPQTTACDDDFRPGPLLAIRTLRLEVPFKKRGASAYVQIGHGLNRMKQPR